MRITDREPHRILTAPFRIKHWRAFIGIAVTFPNPIGAFSRYVTNRGRYPWHTKLRTPLGLVEIRLDDRHDLLTVNEIFCRRDYGAGARLAVVDIGANVGFATLFFLTRARDTRVWAFEPDPRNAERFRENLRGFEHRFFLTVAAVTAEEQSSVRFAPAGRYGHLASPTEPGMVVPAVSIGRALRTVASEAGSIDLVKIDTEGTEVSLIRHIPPDVSIREIRYEDAGGHVAVIRQ